MHEHIISSLLAEHIKSEGGEETKYYSWSSFVNQKQTNKEQETKNEEEDEAKTIIKAVGDEKVKELVVVVYSWQT